MFEKALFHRLLGRLKVGGVKVSYWDGMVATYGPDAPYFEIVIKHPRVLRRMARQLNLGFGESYMDGSLDIIGDITQVGRLASENRSAFAPLARWSLPYRREANRQHRQRRLIARHYDLGNDFYRLWLDESMTYSCAYFQTSHDTLEQAQDHKVQYILRKLQLAPGQTLLDIGCGWGKLLIAAARDYGIKGLGITLSAEQHRLATERVAAAGLEGQVDIELVGYQDVARRDLLFDRIVSVGMYEHVGAGNHHVYFGAIGKLLAPDGLSVLHTITTSQLKPTDAWIDKYIFPGGFLPTVAQTTGLMERFGFELQDFENLRSHYVLTLTEWLRRYESHAPQVLEKYGESFLRMWRLYLAGSISGFRYGDLTLSQFVMTKGPDAELPLTRDYLYAS